MLYNLIFMLIVFPLIELYLLMKIGATFGVGITLFIVVGTGIFGAFIARGEGYKTLLQIRRDMEAGKPPTRGMLNMLLIFIAGIVLLIPGLITDIIGLILLVPYVRNAIITDILNKIGRSGRFGGFNSGSNYIDEDISDGDFFDL